MVSKNLNVVTKVTNIFEVRLLISNLTYTTLINSNIFKGDKDSIRNFMNNFEEELGKIYQGKVADKLVEIYSLYTPELLIKLQDENPQSMEYTEEDLLIVRAGATLHDLSHLDEKVRMMTDSLITKEMIKFSNKN